MKCSEMYEKYGNQKIDFPFDECWFCETIEDCPHPSVSNEGSPICPDECVRKDEIILEKKK